MSGAMYRDDLIQMVHSRDYAGVDSLPLTTKLALIGRLVDGLSIDLDHVKGLIWLAEEPGLPSFLHGSQASPGYSGDGDSRGPSTGRPTTPLMTSMTTLEPPA